MAKGKEPETHITISRLDTACLCGAPLTHRKVAVVEEMLDKAKAFKERGEQIPIGLRIGPQWHRTCRICWARFNTAMEHEHRVRDWKETVEEQMKEPEEAVEQPAVRDEITPEEMISFAQYAFRHGRSVDQINIEIERAHQRRAK